MKLLSCKSPFLQPLKIVLLQKYLCRETIWPQVEDFKLPKPLNGMQRLKRSHKNIGASQLQ